MQRIYITDKQALAYFQEQASPEFWDKHWQTDQLQAIIRRVKDDGLFIPAVKRRLPFGSVVLEGGCGMGQIVHALQYQGYKAIGIDFAARTIQKIKEAVPELDVRLGDVHALDLPDASLDGYISAGVIEHFWGGYNGIAKEMHRTLKTGGFLFVSFPYFSPLRKLKLKLRQYPFRESSALDDQQQQFYQFVLDAARVQADLEALGFELKEQAAYDGIKGFKDEVALFKPYLQQVYDGKRGRILRPFLNLFFQPLASHCILLVLKKVR